MDADGLIVIGAAVPPPSERRRLRNRDAALRGVILGAVAILSGLMLAPIDFPWRVVCSTAAM
jgi:hypothetical protein